MADDLKVDIVTVESVFWQGEASMIVAKTTEGEIGIRAGHQPMLAELDAAGTVTVYTGDSNRRVASVRGGFISVTRTKVSILGEAADWAEDIDKAEAERELAEAGQHEMRIHRAKSRLLALEKAKA